MRGLIPPRAKGISVATAGCRKARSAMTGALNANEGILLIALGLFSANNL